MANPYEVDVVNPLQALLQGQQGYETGVKMQQRSALRDLLSGGGSGPTDWQGLVKKTAAMGDLDSATKIAGISKAISPETSADMQAYGLYRKQEEAAGRVPLPFLGFKTKLNEAGATKVTTNNSVTGGGGSDKQIFDTLSESAAAARTAATGLQGLSEAQKALSGGIISGAGADTRLGLQKVGAFLGVTDPTVIQNTETFRAAIAPQVAAMIKSTVGTANISNSDREFAEKAAGGNINLDAGSIQRLVEIMHKAGAAAVQQHNSKLDAVYPETGGKFGRERALFKVNGVPSINQRLRFNPSTGSLE